MMKAKMKWIFIWLGLSLVLGGGIAGLLRGLDYQALLILPVERDQSVPVGRIVEGQVFQQAVVLPEFDSEVNHAFSLRFATYRTRLEGDVYVILLQGNESRKYTVSASDLKDNETLYFPMDSERFQAGEAILEIRSTSQDSQTAPTVWARTNVKHQELLVNGAPTAMEIQVDFYRYDNCLNMLFSVTGGYLPLVCLLACFGLTLGGLLTAGLRLKPA